MNAPYLLRGVLPVETESSVLISSSKYLNDARLRDWIAMIALRRNGPDMPPQAEMHELPAILDSLRDHDRIEELFYQERKVNPRLDAWFEEGHVSNYTIEDFKDYPAGSVGRIFYDHMTAGNYEIQIVPWSQPKSQLDFYNLRSGQTHDFEHILLGGGFNFMGELVPYWNRLTSVFKHFHSQELAGEVSVIQLLGSLRYTVRTLLHYPQVWQTCVQSIQRGMRAGEESEPFIFAKFEAVFHLPLQEARRVLGIRGVEDIDTDREGAIWAEKLKA